jgi:hypothetical protein
VARNNIRNVTRTRVTVRSLTPSPIAEAVRTQYEERFGNPPEKYSEFHPGLTGATRASSPCHSPTTSSTWSPAWRCSNMGPTMSSRRVSPSCVAFVEVN